MTLGRLTNLSLNFFSCKMEIIIVLHRAIMIISWVNEQYLAHTKNSIKISYSVIRSGVELPKGWGV